MLGSSEEGRGPSIIGTTLKAVAAIGLLSYGASVWLSSSGLDQGTMGRLAAATATGIDDPVTTGSIGRSAASTRLDPCALPRR